VSSPDTADLAQAARQLINTATELGIAAQGFSVSDAAYRQGYAQIYALYEKVSTARQTVQDMGSTLKPQDVSDRIAGLTSGAARAKQALLGVRTGSLLDALLSVEAQLSTLLTNMHQGYVDYGRTDQESAFNLVAATKAP
jgi:hypothetical protein